METKSQIQIRKYLVGLWGLGFGICSLIPGCLSRKERPEAPAVLAFVDGYAIREDALRFRLNLERSKYDEETFKEPGRLHGLKSEILTRMVQNRVITEWGKKKGIVLTDEETAAGVQGLKKGYTEKEFETMLRENEISYRFWRQMAEENLYVQKVTEEAAFQKVKVTPAEIQGYYRQHPDEFKVGERVRVRHLVTDTFEKAKKLHQRISRGENFAKVAVMHSLSPDRSNGGDLGYFTRGTHPKEFDEAAFKLSPGEISPIVKSAYGYHIFKLIDKKPQQVLSLSQASGTIRVELEKRKRSRAYREWLGAISEKAQVQIFEEALEKVEP